MGRAITFGYALDTGLLQTVTDPQGRVISYSYAAGKLVGVTSPWVALAEGDAPRRQ